MNEDNGGTRGSSTEITPIGMEFRGEFCEEEPGECSTEEECNYVGTNVAEVVKGMYGRGSRNG